LAQKDGSNGLGHYFLGQIYESAHDYSNALIEFEMAAEKATKDSNIIDSIIDASRCMHMLGLQDQAHLKIQQQITSTSDQFLRAKLYSGIASLYASGKDYEMQAVSLEKVLEIEPNNIGVRFQAAYAYYEAGLTHLALLHYEALLKFSASPGDASAINNLGVVYDQLSMPLRAVRNFKESAKLNGTLAAANTAGKLIKAGFADEARTILNQAMQQPEHHPNVDSALVTLSQQEEEETKAERAAIEEARRQRTFITEFATSFFTEVSDLPSFAGLWRSADNSLLRLDVLSVIDMEAFTGTISNLGARIKTKYWPTFHDSEVSAYLYLSKDGRRMHFMGRHAFKGYIFETLEKEEGPSTAKSDS
jgi:tetratricopeptide (TPR) repeat protein